MQRTSGSDPLLIVPVMNDLIDHRLYTGHAMGQLRFFRRDKPLRGTITFDSALLNDDEQTGFWSKAWKGMIRLCLITLVAVIVILFKGIPYLRWDQPLMDDKDGAELSENDRAFTRYITLGDARQVAANEFAPGLPVVIFIPHGNHECVGEEASLGVPDGEGANTASENAEHVACTESGSIP
jgi:hypothetical protein